MRLHPRDAIVATARIELIEALTDWQRTHDLTTPELFSVLADVLSSRIAVTAKYLIQVERQGDSR